MSDLSVTEKLSELQRELNVPKQRFNKHLNYYYRNADDILNAAKKIMPNGCYITISDEIVHIGDRYYVKARATFVHKDMQISTEALAREPQNVGKNSEPQITGASSSYARKYALTGLLCLDDGNDDDEISANKEESSFKHTSPRISMEEAMRLSDLITKTKTDVKRLLEAYNVGSLNDLTYEQADDAKYKLFKKLEQINNPNYEYAKV